VSKNKLNRPKKGRILGGVCLALANHFKVNPTIMRLGFVVLILLAGPLILVVYGAAWLLIPSQK
jgi:phage shock protein PspC (stress-responsive transcriptional regulator)